jgi:hypothetical protein
MKNFFRVLGIIALIAVIGFAMVSCEEDNPFVGTWKGSGLTLKCTEDTWAISGAYSASGTYTYSGDKADFKDASGGNFGTATVSGDGDTMTVVSTYGTFAFKKQ